MQGFKRIAGRHVSQKVEVHFANQMLLGQALEKMRREHPEARTLDAILGRNCRKYELPLYDQVHGGVLLLGFGHIASTVSFVKTADVIKAVRTALAWEEDDDLRQWATHVNGVSGVFSCDAVPKRTTRTPVCTCVTGCGHVIMSVCVCNTNGLIAFTMACHDSPFL